MGLIMCFYQFQVKMLIFTQIFAILFIMGGAQRECNHDSQPMCLQKGCYWCPCYKMCVAKEFAFGCDRGCVGHCNDIYKCAADGCIYDYDQERCLDFDEDKKVNFDEVCAQNNENSTHCKSAGCIYCKCEQKCKHPSKYFECDAGCNQWCGDELSEECAAQGCVNFRGSCWDFGRLHRYSTNLCYNHTSTVYRVYYQAFDLSKVKFLDNNIGECFCTNKYASGWTGAEKELWTCSLMSPDMVFSIPIRHAGPYEIGLEMLENIESFGRTQSVDLNGIRILKDFNLDTIGPIGTTTTITKTFEVSCDLNEITIDGKKKAILNRTLELHLTGNDRSTKRGASLNAYYLKTLD